MTADLRPPIGEACSALCAVGRFLHERGWVPATGGNFSLRLDPGRILITASGVHKGELAPDDFVLVDPSGRLLGDGRASYETGLHLQLYRDIPAAQAVLHTHSVANTLLSRRHDRIVLHGYELQKLLPGAPDPAERVEIPVFDNDQDIARLSEVISAHMKDRLPLAGYLIRGHGLYAWGESVAQARHRVEALEFMFECELRSGEVTR
jgi:methylthioribulose-1-phosphate dehydratase